MIGAFTDEVSPRGVKGHEEVHASAVANLVERFSTSRCFPDVNNCFALTGYGGRGESLAVGAEGHVKVVHNVRRTIQWAYQGAGSCVPELHGQISQAGRRQVATRRGQVQAIGTKLHAPNLEVVLAGDRFERFVF